MKAIHIGATVIITGHNKKANAQYDQIVGKKAIIKEIYSGNIALKVEGMNNVGSNYGYFYLSEQYIGFTIEEGEFEMSVVDKLKGSFKVVKIEFLDRAYEINYRMYEDGYEYHEGDVVVVKFARHGLGIAKIKQIFEGVTNQSAENGREIVCPVDMSKYTERESKATKIASLKNQMDKKVKELQGVALYELMAKNCPELQEMLDEYKHLINN